VHGTEATGEQQPGPYFFLSYAHTPRHPGDSDPDLWVEKLYHRLCSHIMHLTAVPEGTQVGFMDRGIRIGEEWPHALAHALEHCRVFVPLYSPRYFRSKECGREWYAFSQRMVNHRTSGADAEDPFPNSHIVPALWAPVQTVDLPQSASVLQFDEPDLGASYVEEGLYALSKLGDYENDYERATYRLAQLIIRRAEEVELPPGRPQNYRELPSAFRRRRQVRTLDVEVLACAADDLPEGRGAHCYGMSAQDWNPYHPESVRAISVHSADIVRNLDYRVSVGEFDGSGVLAAAATAPGGSAPPADPAPIDSPSGPSVLLLDRWALCHKDQRELLEFYRLHQRPWVSVIVLWNQHDPDCARWPEGVAAPRGVPRSVPTLDEFNVMLPKAVRHAFKQYLKHAQTYPPAGPHQSKPRLLGHGPADPPSHGTRHLSLPLPHPPSPPTSPSPDPPHGNDS
jgi:FxsC-like protein